MQKIFTTMPITKDSFLRYRVLDKCFRNPVVRYSIQDLIDKCNEALSFKEKGISLRTVRMDIAYMRSEEGWSAPIKTYRCERGVYYRYSDLDFSIEKKPITEEQLKYVQSAIDALGMINGLDQFKGLDESLAKISLMAYGATAKPCFLLDYNADVAGTDYIRPLFNAIQDNTVVKIKYKPFDKDADEFIIHPHFLKQYNGRWYILGLEQNHPGQIWNLALDRIQDIEPTKIPYETLDVDWNDYFYEIIGVTNEAEVPVEEVHFLAHGKTAHYIATKPIHGTQIPKWIDEHTLDVRINVKINIELKRLLLSYEPFITILSPQSLVEEHKESLKKALEQYQ